MLTSATKTGTSASFVYDPNLRQIQKTVGSTKTKYVYSGSHMMQEWNGTANTLTTRYVYAGAEEPVLQMNSSGTVTYIHHDHHGSVIAQSGSSGAVGNKYKYGPFGESAALTGTTIGYTGQRFDSETGLYHYRARYYMPSIGRFLQADPIGYAAGMNLYAYCGNDAMNHTDPNGLERFGIGIESPDKSAIHDGKLNPLESTGHTLSYVRDKKGRITNELSVGPAKQIGMREVKDFKNGTLPATGKFPLDKDIHAFEFPISKKQYERASQIMDLRKKNPGCYSPTAQCTSAAIDVGKAIGVKLPDGKSTVEIPGYFKGNLPNPYGLEKQLNQKGVKSTTLQPSDF